MPPQQPICETKRIPCMLFQPCSSRHFVFLAFMFWIFSFQIVRLQDVDLSMSKICNLQKTCSACIKIAPECAWCKAEKSKIAYHELRCDVLSNFEGDCPMEDIVNPKTHLQFLNSMPLSEPGEGIGSLISLTPQKLELKLRPNSPQRFEVQFRQTMDYPLDLYYLMDMSESMSDDKDKLANLGILLGSTLKNMSSNIQIGYGTFVDKKEMPYSDMRLDYLENPCLALETTCVASYGFRNNMKLNEDFNTFSLEVKNTNVSANLDNPEGALDALLQTIVCNKEIGWRNQSRKIILLATDSEFHTAGDGKLGGIVQPNDGQCHLDNNNDYTKSTTQDYPSLSQIITTVRDNDVTVIFATNDVNIDLYSRLKDFLPGAKIAELAKDSSNIVELIEKQYREITASVELTNESNDLFSVNYYTNCSSSQGEFLHRNTCTGLKTGDTVFFEVEINVHTCPYSPADRRQILEISPVGLSDRLTIELELICDCDCESAPFEVVNSPKCSEIGTYECGICNCLGMRLGDYCECSADSAFDVIGGSHCKSNNSEVICSGRGVCECGKCSCYQSREITFYGDLCQCNDFSCPYYNGELCGGKEQGNCICGFCRCNANFKGEDCGCKNSTDDCIGDNGKLCSDIGECVCGSCQCPLDYGGALCEEYLNVEAVCNKSSQCLFCNNSGEAPDAQFECDNCDIQTVDDLGALQEGESQCVFIDENKCRVFFHILTNSSQNLSTTIQLRVSINKECVQQANLSLIIPIILAIVVGIGLIIIIFWKIITTLHDNREFAKFNKEIKASKFNADENPVYREPTRNYENPTYGKTFSD